MARNPPLLTSSAPAVLAPAQVTIGHLQLRDLILCPRERGVVNYVQDRSIIEHDLHSPHSTPTAIANLNFVPNAIAALPIPDSDATLFAAGGIDADIQLSLHLPAFSSEHEGESSSSALWQFPAKLPGSINNSVLLTSMSLARSYESSVEPKIAISNNDCTVKFYDIPIRGKAPPKFLKESGILRLDVAVNHSSLSPDGRTLLSVGDSAKVYLHRLSGGRSTTFTPIITLTLPPSTIPPLNYAASSPAASFSTAFSANGSKFAVASQEGSVVVWDVRSSKPLKIYHTDKTRSSNSKSDGNGSATGWLNDDLWDWSRGGSRAPGWGVRSVKFGTGGQCGYLGKECMVFTEHTSLVHIIDAQTFDSEEIVRMPSISDQTRQQPTSPRRSRSPPHVVVSGAALSRPSPHERPPPPPIVLALQDTFRIPSDISAQTSSAAARRRARRIRARAGDLQSEEDDIMLIPPLGDRAVENNVQRLLEHHGGRARHRDAYADAEDAAAASGFVGSDQGRAGDDMEVDELESDCASSHAPSRVPSPALPASVLPPVPAAPVPVSNTNFIRFPSMRTRRRTWTQDDFRATRDARAPGPIAHLSTPEEVDGDANVGADDGDSEVDLAGICFDPSGGHVYVASVNGVAEWSLRGAEKRWWADGAWV